MASNPLIDQGNLNRLIGSVLFPRFPGLNVTAPFLGKAGISLAFEGDATTQIETMTGAVNSPEPYQRCSVTINLLKTQPLASVYKSQIEAFTVLGPATIKPDTAAHPSYKLQNVSIKGFRDLNMSGEDPVLAVALQGYYIINNDLWNLV